MQNDNITIPIPTELGQLTKLQTLDLSSNNIVSGEIIISVHDFKRYRSTLLSFSLFLSLFPFSRGVPITEAENEDCVSHVKTDFFPTDLLHYITGQRISFTSTLFPLAQPIAQGQWFICIFRLWP